MEDKNRYKPKHQTNYYHFRVANNDLPMKPVPGVEITFIEEENNRLSIALKISDYTDSENIRNAIPCLLQWKDRLIKWQGVDLTLTYHALRNELYLAHQKGASYSELAEMKNRLFYGQLYLYYDLFKDISKVSGNFRTQSDFFMWLSGDHICRIFPETPFSRFDIYLGFTNAVLSLQMYGIDPLESAEIATVMLKDLRNGESPTAMNKYPINELQIQKLIRNWKNLLKKIPDMLLLEVYSGSRMRLVRKQNIDQDPDYNGIDNMWEGFSRWDESQIWDPFGVLADKKSP